MCPRAIPILTLRYKKIKQREQTKRLKKEICCWCLWNGAKNIIKSNVLARVCERQIETKADVWVMFSFCLAEFENVCRGWTGGQAIRKIDVHADVCTCVYICARMFLLWHHCCRHCSHLTVTPLWLKAWQPPTLSPHQTLLLLLPGFIYNLTPPRSLLVPRFLPSSSTLFSHPCPLFISHHPPSRSFFLFCFPPITRSPSFGVWVFPAFRHALCTHSAPCLCLYGNPEWTWVAQRSVKHWYRHY